MSVILRLTTANGRLQAAHEAILLADTPTAALPGRADCLAQPYEHGPALFAALGGPALLALLDADPERLLYLDIPPGDPADVIPWECAIVAPKTFLVHRYGLLRLVAREVILDPTPAPLHLLALGADALVDRHGRARDTYRLDILAEMRQIERVIMSSKQAVSGARIAPTAAALRAALSAHPRALLHLSCHGDVIQTDHGLQPVLHLEDENGGPELLLGSDLISAARLSDLRLMLLSACRTDQQAAVQGRLARALVESGVPAAIGMQGPFPDDLSDDLAAALYRSLLSGRPLGQALMAARMALSKDETAVPLPVAYVARGGDAPLPLQPGHPARQRLDLSAHCHLPTAVQAPDPFLGRNAELHQLAQLAADHPVITIIGAGGMGKTALAAAYARRFALRYLDGVIGYSFAAGDVDDGAFRRELLDRLVGDGAAVGMADQSAARQAQIILDELRQREALLLVDNYESVQDAYGDTAHPHHAAARAVHALLAKIASNGGRLLLTSRRQPAGLKHEHIFPGRDRLLQGVDEQAGAALFFASSPRAKEKQDEPAMQKLARAVARATGGHPLAIALLGSEYDQGHTPPDRFLADWPAQLHAARGAALDDHHATFAVAFNRSYDALSAAGQSRLRALSVIPFPFFAEGAARLWGLAESDDDERGQTRRHLRELADRSLIEIEGYYTDDTPATWRFQPAVRQAAAHRLPPQEQAALQVPFARYAAWLSSRAYGDIHKEGNAALVRLVRPALDSLAAAADHLTGTERLWHLRNVGWLLEAFGRTGEAYGLLTAVLAEKNLAAAAAAEESEAVEWQKVRSSLLHQLARLEVTRGDLDRALALYQQSLADSEQIGDIQGKAASLSMMSNVYWERGDLETAKSLVQQGIAIEESLGNIQGAAIDLVKLGQIAQRLQQPDEASAYYQRGLAFLRQLGAVREIAQVEDLLSRLDRPAVNTPGSDDQTAELESLLAQLSPEERAQAEAQLETAARLQQTLQQAQSAAERRLWPAAIAHQQDAVAHARALARQTGQREALVQLSVLLYNLAGYYQQAARHPEAVAAYAEVVALDEQTGHEDLEADRQALAQARRLAASASSATATAVEAVVEPAETHLAALLAQLSPADRAALAQMPPQQQEQALQAIAHFAALPPDEQEALHRRAHFAQVEGSLLHQLGDLFDALRQGALDDAQQQVVAAQIDAITAQVTADAALGEQRHSLTALLRCAAAHLRGAGLPPIPAAYAAQWAAWFGGMDG